MYSYWGYYTEGLGETYTYTFGGDGSEMFLYETDTLIYYSKGNEKWGKPYYLADGQSYIHFTPIPETCAVWNDINDVIEEQIKTGNSIPFNGHTYVEMLYSAYNLYTHVYSPDSLIGYFRNDTINKETFFYHTLTNTPFFTYNFNQLVDGINCTSVDTILVNGQRRTRWTNNSIGLQYVEGIGGLCGLIPVHRVDRICGNGWNTPSCDFGTLTCFSICGETIYPSNTAAACPLISGINEVNSVKGQIKIYPNPAADYIKVNVEVSEVGDELEVFDFMGDEISKYIISNSEYRIPVGALPAGLYLIKISSGNGRIGVGRFVKE